MKALYCALIVFSASGFAGCQIFRGSAAPPIRGKARFTVTRQDKKQNLVLDLDYVEGVNPKNANSVLARCGSCTFDDEVKVPAVGTVTKDYPWTPVAYDATSNSWSQSFSVDDAQVVWIQLRVTSRSGEVTYGFRTFLPNEGNPKHWLLEERPVE